VLTMAMADPLRFSLVQDLEQLTGYRITQVVATRRDIVAAIERAYAAATDDPPLETAADFVRAIAGDQPGAALPAAALVDRLIARAFDSGATDIHIEPTEHDTLIRERLDGSLRIVERLPRSGHEALVAHVKAIGGMDRTET